MHGAALGGKSWLEADGGALACRESGVKGKLACPVKALTCRGYKASAVGRRLGPGTSRSGRAPHRAEILAGDKIYFRDTGVDEQEYNEARVWGFGDAFWIICFQFSHGMILHGYTVRGRYSIQMRDRAFPINCFAQN